MNIFILDPEPVGAARSYVDRHVASGIAELAELLSTAHVLLDGRIAAETRITVVHRPMYVNHPCSKWVRESRFNYDWTASLAWHLIQQFNFRFHRGHEFVRMVADYQRFRPLNIPMVESTPFVQSMPIQFKQSNPVDAYRNYYYRTRKHLAEWTNVGKPAWWTEIEQNEEKAHG